MNPLLLPLLCMKKLWPPLNPTFLHPYKLQEADRGHVGHEKDQRGRVLLLLPQVNKPLTLQPKPCPSCYFSLPQFKDHCLQGTAHPRASQGLFQGPAERGKGLDPGAVGSAIHPRLGLSGLSGPICGPDRRSQSLRLTQCVPSTLSHIRIFAPTWPWSTRGSQQTPFPPGTELSP